MEVAKVKVGGQALPDGVLMRTARAWAIARADGTVTTGDVRPTRWQGVPVLRVVASLGQAVRLGFGPATGGIRRRSPGWPLIRALVLTEAAAALFTWAVSAGHVDLGGRWPAGIAVWIVAIAVFRLTSPARQWQYHGAEHKAVSAHENDIPLDDTAAVLGCSRIHPRCGTNLMPWLAVAAPAISTIPWPVQPVAFVLLLAVAAETMTLAGKRPNSVAGRVLLVPGFFLQRTVTTREPTPEQQSVGCRALLACLDRHHHRVAANAGREVVRRDGPGR